MNHQGRPELLYLISITMLRASAMLIYCSSLVAQMVKNPPTIQETPVRSLGWEDPLEKGMEPTPVFSPAESHGQRKLAGYIPRGHRESGTT